MAFSEFEVYRYHKMLAGFCETYGPPMQIRHHVAWGFAINGPSQYAELYEMRPDLLDENKSAAKPVARARFIKSRWIWKIYWMRSTGRWVAYEQCPYAPSLESFLKIVRKDSCRCFFG